ncbi:MAG TPA: hypothetical protein VGZ71_04050 [Puia sp.]|nr:hypothetical protein [Puia sp.]
MADNFEKERERVKLFCNKFGKNLSPDDMEDVVQEMVKIDFNTRGEIICELSQEILKFIMQHGDKVLEKHEGQALALISMSLSALNDATFTLAAVSGMDHASFIYAMENVVNNFKNDKSKESFEKMMKKNT